MTETNQPMRPQGDDISLVDVATVFVRRRTAFFMVFLFALLLGAVYAFLQKDTWSVQYVTTIRLAELPGRNESVASVLRTIDSKWMIRAAEDYQIQHEGQLTNVFSRRVPDTELIELVSRGANLDKQRVLDSHRVLAELVVNDQNARLESVVGPYKQQLRSLERKVEDSNDGLHPTELRAKLDLQEQVLTAQPAEILALADENRKVNRAPSLKLVVTLSAVVGLLLGMIAPFIVEFVCQVRSRLRELSTE